MQGLEGQDGNSSESGKLSRVSLCSLRQNALSYVMFVWDGFIKGFRKTNEIPCSTLPTVWGTL